MSKLFKKDEHTAEEEAPLKNPPELSVDPAREQAPPESSLAPSQSALLNLQRAYGNQFVVRMLRGVDHPAGGQTLEPDTRTAMESKLGQDFSKVRVHQDHEAGHAADALGAQAFTSGRDVFFAQGKYRGDAADPLLAHELAHVAQQDGEASGPSASNDSFEAQAEQAESVVASGRGSVSLSTGAHGVQRKPAQGSAATAAPSAPAGTPSFWQSLGHGIASAATTVAHGLEAAGGAVWAGMKAVGHAVGTAAEAVWSGLQWVGQQLWTKVTGIFERVTHWLTRLPERLARLLLGLWEGVKSMKPWALKWWESLGKADTWLDFLKWLGSRVIDLVEILGLGESYETVMDFLKFNTRSLTGEEVGKASSVFGSSINYSLVRVDERAVLGPSFGDQRQYTSFHTINGWGHTPDYTLIHELTHVWQYERAGAIYMPQAIHAQMTLGGNMAYDYGDVDGLRAAKHAGQGILSFNREQQAQIVEDFFLLKTHRPAMKAPAATVADLPLFAHFVKDVSTLSPGQLVSG